MNVLVKRRSLFLPLLWRRTITTPVSRRRRGGLHGVEVEQVKSFEDHAQELLRDIKRAFEPLQPLNDPFLLTLTPGEVCIDVGAKKGKFVVAIDREQEVVSYLSPVAGAFQYAFDEEEGQWLSQVDQHNLRGMLTRDWLRQCVGCPQL